MRNQYKETKGNRRAFLGAIGTAATLSFAGCLGGGDDEEFIRYLGWGGNTQEAAEAVFEQWTEESGVEVRHESAGGDVEFVEFLEQNPGEIDLFLPSSFGISEARDRDLLLELDYSEVPNYEENMRDEWLDLPYIEDDAFHRDVLTQGIAYNTEYVDSDISSWEDLKDPELEGQVALREDAVSRFTNAAQAIDVDVNEVPDDEGLFEEVIEELEEQDENVFSYWDSGAQSMQYLQEENAWMCEAWGGRTLAVQEEGFDQIEYAIPEEGTAVITEDYSIPADSENVDLVYDLLDFAYEREHLIDISLDLGYPVPVVDTPEEIQDLPDYVETPDSLEFVDWEAVLPVQDDWQAAFDEIRTA